MVSEKGVQNELQLSTGARAAAVGTLKLSRQLRLAHRTL